MLTVVSRCVTIASLHDQQTCDLRGNRRSPLLMIVMEGQISMSKSVKILLLILTILPIVLFVGAYVGVIILAVISESTNQAAPSDTLSAGALIALFAGIGLSSLLSIGMLIFYIVNLVQTNRVPKDLKPVWGVLFIFAYWISWVVYWFVYIWPEPTPTQDQTISMIPPAEHESQT